MTCRIAPNDARNSVLAGLTQRPWQREIPMTLHPRPGEGSGESP
jgi:hypothetical protein